MAGNGVASNLVWELSRESWGRIEAILMNEGTRISTAAGKTPNGAKHRDDVVLVKDPYYILAPSPLDDERNRVLKHGETFAVLDHYGDIRPAGMGEEGLYHEGTRYLSSFILKLSQERPLLLSSTVKEDNVLLTVDLTNTDIYEQDRVIIPRGALHIFRSKFLWLGACYERLQIQNYDLRPIQASFTLQFQADFADIFEVRGTKRQRRGEYLVPTIEDDVVVLPYRGLDGVVRRTRLVLSPRPRQMSASEICFDVNLPPHGEAIYHLTVTCEREGASTRVFTYENAVAQADAGLHTARGEAAHVHTSNEQFNDWLHRSSADLCMMVTDTPEGPYPYAGVPWFSAPFGRDGIITALQCLCLNPALARGVLGYLAATQADAVVAEQDAEPGKILHEARQGEMAALREIPFGRYYGSVDATPLFVVLAGAYHERTGDRAFLERTWPHVERALHWLESYGDQDGDGFVEYFRKTPRGLAQQGWKDSHDSVWHADGALAEGPIALCEVQGYVYAAWRGAAQLAAALGHADRARELTDRALALQERFDQAFWCEDIGTYALALDGNKRPCRIRTSNAGQCLFTGIVRPHRARRVAQTLLAENAFSGWGIRTVAAGEARYNPMSYHNGSIWPHDNALIAHGLAQYHLKDAVLKILTGMFDASLFVELHRMPELFCGFPRRAGEGPTLYPVACSPQSWAAGTVFLLLQACLGLRIQAEPARLVLAHARLPESLKQVVIRNLKIADAVVDLRFERHHGSVGVEILRREGEVEVMAVK